MKKLYNFRLETNLIKEVDKLNGSRTFNVTNALQTYLYPDDKNSYNVNIVDLLNNHISDLKQDKKFLQEQVNALLIAKIPLLARIKMKLLQENSKTNDRTKHL